MPSVATNISFAPSSRAGADAGGVDAGGGFTGAGAAAGAAAFNTGEAAARVVWASRTAGVTTAAGPGSLVGEEDVFAAAIGAELSVCVDEVFADVEGEPSDSAATTAAPTATVAPPTHHIVLDDPAGAEIGRAHV